MHGTLARRCGVDQHHADGRGASLLEPVGDLVRHPAAGGVADQEKRLAAGVADRRLGLVGHDSSRPAINLSPKPHRSVGAAHDEVAARIIVGDRGVAAWFDAIQITEADPSMDLMPRPAGLIRMAGRHWISRPRRRALR